MLEILYCNQNNIISAIAESLVVGGLPMETKKITSEGLNKEIPDLEEILGTIWHNKEYFIFDKKK